MDLASRAALAASKVSLSLAPNVSLWIAKPVLGAAVKRHAPPGFLKTALKWPQSGFEGHPCECVPTKQRFVKYNISSYKHHNEKSTDKRTSDD